jgi:hypothetical protein
MACTLTSGRILPCKTSVGGLKAVYFADYNTLGNVTISAGEITTVDGTPSFFKFDIKGNSSLETTINSSRENGTTFYTQTLNLTLPVLDKATQEEIKILAAARPYVVVEDYNGNFMLLGLENGCEVTGGTIVSGAAMGDLSGFTLTLEGQEKQPPVWIASNIITDNEGAQSIDPNS